MLNRESSKSLIDILCETGDEALGRPRGYTLSMLFIEALSMGRYLPVRDFERIGATPHVYDWKMEKFYKTTETYIPGLLRWHLSLERLLLRRQMLEVINILYQTKAKRDIYILCLGDGIGIDSLVFARYGYNVTYFDYDGPSLNYAELLFKRFGVKVTIITEVQALEKGHYDFIVNCDVLEHVPDPKLIISEMAECLKPEGLALVTEAFAWLEPYAVSHLLSNVAYVGNLPKLFAEYDMNLVRREPGSRLHVYSKATGHELKMQRKLLGYSPLTAWKVCAREKLALLKRRLRRQYPFGKKMADEGAHVRKNLLQYGDALQAGFDSNSDPQKCLDLLLGCKFE